MEDPLKRLHRSKLLLCSQKAHLYIIGVLNLNLTCLMCRQSLCAGRELGMLLSLRVKKRGLCSQAKSSRNSDKN